MDKISLFQDLIQNKLQEIKFRGYPAELYEPVEYAMTMGGKRIRPLLVLLGCDIFEGDVNKAMPAAISLEVFHNFTLVHDDIMDSAPLRRGKETVCKKWNTNIGILSGDTMYAKAYELMLQSEDVFLKPLMQILTRAAVEVCEGQQMDMNFESQETVTIKEYLEMIRLKTAVLAASCLRAGAVTAGANFRNSEEIYSFGENLGMAFQLMDDILDVFSDEKKFGKKTGGDIVSNKKTYLCLKAFELADEHSLMSLKHHFGSQTQDSERKIKEVTEIYLKLDVKSHAEAEMQHFYQKALQHLDNINVSAKNKEPLSSLARMLMKRDF